MINNLHYADDTTLLAGSASELENLIERVRVESFTSFWMWARQNGDCQPRGREHTYSCRKPSNWNSQPVKLSADHDIKPGKMFNWIKAQNCNGKNIHVCDEQDREEQKHYNKNEDQTSFHPNVSNCNICMWNLVYQCCRLKNNWCLWDVVLEKASAYPRTTKRTNESILLEIWGKADSSMQLYNKHWNILVTLIDVKQTIGDTDNVWFSQHTVVIQELKIERNGRNSSKWSRILRNE